MASELKKIQAFFKKYGKLAVVTHVAMSFLTFSMLYTAFSAGVDVKKYLPFKLETENDLKQTENEDKEIKKKHKLGTFAAAFIVNKALTPFRIPIEIALVTFLARRLRI